MEKLTNDEIRTTLLDYLEIEDPQLKKDKENLQLSDLMDILIGNHNDALLQNAILENAYFSKVPQANFEKFQDQVLQKIDDIEEGGKASEDFIEEIAIINGGVKQNDLN